MATYNVDPAGGQTYTTVQAALNAAGAAYATGDYTPDIICWPGIYTEGTLNLVTAGGGWLCAALIRAQDPNNKPVFTSTTAGHGVDCNSSPKVNYGTRIAEFRDIIWSTWANTSGLVAAGSSSAPMKFLRCEFDTIKLTSTVFVSPAGGTGASYMWIIDSCRFKATGAVLSTIEAGYGMARNCRFTWAPGSSDSMVVAFLAGWFAHNNSVYSSVSGGYLFSVGGAKNNAIKVQAGTAPLKVFNCTGVYDYNCTHGWAGSNTGTNGGHNMVGFDPGFTNYATGDFSITTGSPCYNAGTSLAGIVDLDYVGTARPKGASFDIGAYEVIPTTTVSSITVLSPTSIRLNLSASVASDATWATAGNFTITTGTGSAVTVSSAAASGNPGSSITLTTSEHTNGATYAVAWSGLTNVTSSSTTYTGQGVAPALTSASFTSAGTIRVTWAETMANNAALVTASNYTITPLDAAPFAPSAVTRISSTVVDLTIGRSLGKSTGTLSVTGPQDVALNTASGVTTALTAWSSSVSGITPYLSSGASFIRLTFAAPVFIDSATWIASNVTTTPSLSRAYYAAGGSPATYLDLITSGQSNGDSYGVSWYGLLGISNGSSSFAGIGLPSAGPETSARYGSTTGLSGSGGAIDGLTDFDIMPAGIGSELSWERLVLVSLFTDGRIDPAAAPPDGTTDRRGWWADTYTDGAPAASRLWLISGSSAPTARAIEDAISDGLKWAVEDGLADAIDVSTTLVGGRADSIVTITAQGQAVVVRVPALWSDYAG